MGGGGGERGGGGSSEPEPPLDQFVCEMRIDKWEVPFPSAAQHIGN